MKQIRVLVVDDSAFLRRYLPTILETDRDINVVGTAANGLEAIEMVKKLRPDVVTLDVNMPVMDGLTALRRIMQETPTPVLMLSALTSDGAKETMEALSLGAVDYITKPVDITLGGVRKDLVEKIKTVYAAKVKVVAGVNVAAEKFRRLISDLSMEAASWPGKMPAGPWTDNKELVAIAASTGGPVALQLVLRNLLPTIPVGLVIVQHIAEGFSQALAERLNAVSPLEVRMSEGQELVRPGLGLLAPAGQHLTVTRRNGKLYTALSDQPADTVHRPSADVLFSSVAQICGAKACAVIMTGMGNDGARGIKEIRDKGGATIAQDEDTSVIFGMPQAAINGGGIDIVAPLEKIPGEIMQVLYRSGARAS